MLPGTTEGCAAEQRVMGNEGLEGTSKRSGFETKLTSNPDLPLRTVALVQLLQLLNIFKQLILYK